MSVTAGFPRASVVLAPGDFPSALFQPDKSCSVAQK
jgi:hypothetical protein